jgi:hypothetical protein
MAAERNISVYKGDTYTHSVTIKNSSNVAIDVSLRTYVAQIKESSAASASLLSFDIDDSNGANGVVVLSLTSNQTSTLKSGKYYYDLQETAGNVVTTLMYGNVSVTGDISNVS